MNAERGSVFERRFANEFKTLSRVIEDAVRFLHERGVAARAVNLVHLTVEELATNILKYAYDDTAPHDILLQVRIEPGTLCVVLEDDGRAFNPLEAPQPNLHLSLEQREPGGLGVHLVRKLAARMDYERCGGRNRVAIRIAS